MVSSTVDTTSTLDTSSTVVIKWTPVDQCSIPYDQYSGHQMDTSSTVSTKWRAEHRAAMNFGVASIPLPNGRHQMKPKLQLQECNVIISNRLFCQHLDY